MFALLGAVLAAEALAVAFYACSFFGTLNLVLAAVVCAAMIHAPTDMLRFALPALLPLILFMANDT